MELLSRRAAMATRIRLIWEQVSRVTEELDRLKLVELRDQLLQAELELIAVHDELLQPARRVSQPRPEQRKACEQQECLPF